MADEPLKFPSGADIKRDTQALTAMVEAKTRAIMLAIQASADKQDWSPDHIHDLAMRFYKFLMGDNDGAAPKP